MFRGDRLSWIFRHCAAAMVLCTCTFVLFVHALGDLQGNNKFRNQVDKLEWLHIKHCMVCLKEQESEERRQG